MHSDSSDSSHTKSNPDLDHLERSTAKKNKTSSWWSTQFPWDPKKFPFFYGWVIVFVGSIGIIMSIPGQTMGVSVFTEPLMAALDVSRFQLSLAYMIGTMASGFLMRRGGRALDRLGARKTGFLSSVALGLCLIYLATVDHIAGWVNLGWWMAMFLAVIGFLGIRFTGQGMLTMVSRAMISKWFERRRGLIMSISGVVVSFFFAVSPQGLGALVDRFGWRGAWLILAGIAIGVVGPIIWWAFRDNPEECGLRMDGESPAEMEMEFKGDQKEDEKSKEPNAAPATSSVKSMSQSESESQSESLPENSKPAKRPKAKRQPKFPLRREYEAREALRTLAFWAFNGVLALFGLIATAYTFHIDAVGLEMGLDTRTVRSVFLPMAFVGVSFNFLAGWMSDQFRLKWVMIQMCLGIIIGLAGMLAMPHPVAWWVWILGIGAAQGYYGVLVAVAWPRYFGRAHLGEISGVNMSSMVIASSLGPILFSLTKDYWGGSFKVGMWVCLILTVIFLALGFFVKNPQESEPDPDV